MPRDDLATRRATEEDRFAVTELFRETGWEDEPLLDGAWVISQADVVLGVVTLVELGPTETFIDAVVVSEASRRCGVGSTLLDRVLAMRNATWWLECREELIPFYARFGFSHAGDVPVDIRRLVPSRSDRAQWFLRRDH